MVCELCFKAIKKKEIVVKEIEVLGLHTSIFLWLFLWSNRTGKLFKKLYILSVEFMSREKKAKRES